MDVEIKKDVQTSVRYGGFWVRGAAHIIDGFILSIISMIVLIPIYVIFSVGLAATEFKFLEFILQVVVSVISMAVGWSYYIFMTHKYQATLGKMAIGARVQAEDGQNLTLGKIILRETVGRFVAGIMLGIGYIMIGFTTKKQGVHDLISQSVVVYTNEGPRKIVVGIIYGFYVFLITVIMCIAALVLFFVVLAVTRDGDVSTDTENGAEHVEERDVDDVSDDIIIPQNSIRGDEASVDQVS